MIDRKLSLLVSRFPYGGVGASTSEVHWIGNYLLRLSKVLFKDERIGEVHHAEFADCPTTMVRNDAVCTAREIGVDMLLMIDSDMVPDYENGAKPFWQTSFDFLYKHYEKGPVCIAAPYCGPPPYENMYVFRWGNKQNDSPGEHWSLDQYTREEAAMWAGICPVAALPTGLILFDMRCFDLTEPKDEKDEPWFYYNYTDKYQRRKASTEDVTMTRDLSLAGIEQLGYNPVFCNWDCWAGHVKPKIVTKPRTLYAGDVSRKMKRLLQNGEPERGEYITDVGAGQEPDIMLTPEQRVQLEAGLASGELDPGNFAIALPSSNGN